MPYSSTTVCGNILKAIFRTAHTSDFPSTYYVALFDGDPEAGGVEPDSTGGYARLAVANTNAEFTISGDTVTNVTDPCAEPLPGFQEIRANSVLSCDCRDTHT